MQFVFKMLIGHALNTDLMVTFLILQTSHKCFIPAFYIKPSLSVLQGALVFIQEKFMQKRPPAPAFSIANSSATTGWILFKFCTFVVALGNFSEYGIMTF